MLNATTFLGNLTRDPQVRFFANERAVASFNVAVNRKWRDSNQQVKEEVTYVECEAWGRTAETVGQYLVKGSRIIVQGRLKTDTWTDKESGAKRSKLMVVAEHVVFLDRKADGSASGEAPSHAGVPHSAPLDDEPPF